MGGLAFCLLVADRKKGRVALVCEAGRALWMGSDGRKDKLDEQGHPRRVSPFDLDLHQALPASLRFLPSRWSAEKRWAGVLGGSQYC